MKRSLAITALLLVAAACAAVRPHAANPYEQPPFYAKYLNTGSQLDAQITATLAALEANPNAASLHNELGSMLVQKNFPKDAAVEFERAIAIDKDFYPAWYNLGLVRASMGDTDGANRAMERTVDLKPGHPQALFQLGLTAEKLGQNEKASDYYAKAFMHNARLMDVRYNPRLVESKLTHLALLKLYARTQSRQGMTFQGAPPGYIDRAAVEVTAPQDQLTPPTVPEPAPAPVEPITAPADPATQTST